METNQNQQKNQQSNHHSNNEGAYKEDAEFKNQNANPGLQDTDQQNPDFNQNQLNTQIQNLNTDEVETIDEDEEEEEGDDDENVIVEDITEEESDEEVEENSFKNSRV